MLQNGLKDRSARPLVAVGLLCLSAGLLEPMVVHPATGLGRNLVEGSRGFLIGLSITLILAATWAGRSRRHG